MALVRWDPWRDMLDLQREAQELFRRFFDEGPRLSFTTWTPAVEMFERDRAIYARALAQGA